MKTQELSLYLDHFSFCARSHHKGLKKITHSVYPSLIRLCKYLRRRWTEELFQELICLIVLYFGLQMHLSSFAQLFTSSVAYMTSVANMAPGLGIVLLSSKMLMLIEKSAMRYLYWLLDMHFAFYSLFSFFYVSVFWPLQDLLALSLPSSLRPAIVMALQSSDGQLY